MKVKGERCKRIQRPHLAWVVVAHALLHCMPDQLLICQDNEMSSPMLILKVIKTVIEGKQLTPNAQSCFKLPEDSEKASSIHFQRGTTLLRVEDDATLSHLLVPALLLRTLR
ncbi:hypothetical protein T4B_15623 [Trichinella pseudospiralis]|nr:hypothetical protein T4A_12763 [Trichinella pseudospiralis]KRZ00586.1 hypothetical protein T4B_6228 [Trichinella pseudospiralis]KRZ23795.1 hypothetical protein T4B_15623 [Trichinella pseudospiralis]KRZ40583.1 hypothetical protein T4C_7986 [Trichinella pseudospiralis]